MILNTRKSKISHSLYPQGAMRIEVMPHVIGVKMDVWQGTKRT